MKANILKNILHVYTNDQYQVYDKHEYMCNNESVWRISGSE